MLDKSKLKRCWFNDPTIYIDEIEDYLYQYCVEPVFNVEGKRLAWVVMHSRSGIIHESKTKKEAMEYVREAIHEIEHPWYEGLPGWDTPQGVYISDGVYGHKHGRLSENI
tara:strand:- start:198 stop:527 length:330 start_codon:yes stop_codon:yes gene_type:complete